MSEVKSQYGKGVEICVSWVKANKGGIPPKAVNAGGTCYVARAEHEDQYIPGKLVVGFSGVYVSFDGKDYCKSYYEVNYFFTWI